MDGSRAMSLATSSLSEGVRPLRRTWRWRIRNTHAASSAERASFNLLRRQHTSTHKERNTFTPTHELRRRQGLQRMQLCTGPEKTTQREISWSQTDHIVVCQGHGARSHKSADSAEESAVVLSHCHHNDVEGGHDRCLLGLIARQLNLRRGHQVAVILRA